MKTIRNYKHIRRKPDIYGFSPNGFYLFSALAIMSLLTLSGGFSFKKLIIILLFNSINLVVTKLIISNDKILRKILDEKFPTEISHLNRRKVNKYKK
ncbi:hypothetical protein [Riemerella anatipestifer]|uniref:hypothetical protein n=1 Tax=Riemerella anatipestifer TaxID=34085 RepID=UPI00129EA15B|nr:hypothetical protein [Riemerella anatipestifer]MRM84277.1 hypothetical protein [Riemerella anatipestifer]